MPVDEKPVHPLTVAGERYGCHNRAEFSEGYYAPNRDYLPDGRWFDNLKFIPHRMSTECRFDMSLTSDRCDGCFRRGSGEAYDQMMRAKGQA